MKDRVTTYLESSFLSPLLLDPNITDISYNGEALFYEHNKDGRMKADIEVSSEEVAFFLRQIANFSEKQFSYSSPILNLSFANYRLNAIFQNIVRVKDKKSYSFSLRIGHEGSLIEEGSDFLPVKAGKILMKALEEKKSIVISGATSSGKTELQKYLMMKMKEATRLIVIDDVEELEMARNDTLDITTWVVDERFPESSFSSLIANALRNDPDYIMVAESRGKEMLEAITSVMSGHPIIISIHSHNLDEIISRMASLAMQGNPNLKKEEVISDIKGCFSYFVFLKKEVNEIGNIRRYVDEIGVLENKEMKILYKRKKDE